MGKIKQIPGIRSGICPDFSEADDGVVLEDKYVRREINFDGCITTTIKQPYMSKVTPKDGSEPHSVKRYRKYTFTLTPTFLTNTSGSWTNRETVTEKSNKSMTRKVVKEMVNKLITDPETGEVTEHKQPVYETEIVDGNEVVKTETYYPDVQVEKRPRFVWKDRFDTLELTEGKLKSAETISFNSTNRKSFRWVFESSTLKMVPGLGGIVRVLTNQNKSIGVHFLVPNAISGCGRDIRTVWEVKAEELILRILDDLSKPYIVGHEVVKRIPTDDDPSETTVRYIRKIWEIPFTISMGD